MLAGSQTIILNDHGAAIGGTFSLNHVSGGIGNIVVPQGVTAMYDFGATSGSTLNIAGNLTNAGTLQAISSSAGVTTASISAVNIWNQSSGLITSLLPQGLPSAVSALNLQLIASQNFINAGTIASSGSLSVVAGGSIVNAASRSQFQLRAWGW